MAMRTFPQEMVALGKLRPAEYNPREMSEVDLAKLLHGIEEFGMVEPVVARREDGLIIGGHQRVEAIRRLLLRQGVANPDAEMVPVIYVEGLTDERAKLLNLALNRIHGEFDYSKLNDVLTGLTVDGMKPEELALSGFSDNEVRDILALMEDSKLAVPESDEPVEDADAVIAAEARKFAFELDDSDDAKLCTTTLRTFGMTGPKNAADAFVKAMRAALVSRTEATAVPDDLDATTGGEDKP